MLMAEYFNLSETESQTLKLSAFVHDIGKIEVEREILNKPLPLNDEEWGIIKQHPVWGAEIVSAIGVLQRCKPVILAHHENFDGSGYPNGLKGEEIPFAARILRVVDSFDAMVTNRPYRQALSFEESLAEIQLKAGSYFDPQVVEAFIKVSGRISQLLVS
ncbi:MAG: HD domain-containing protein [Clostridia bacterium]|nr:HD domain-containing protein [Clostridia bacterium]